VSAWWGRVRFLRGSIGSSLYGAMLGVMLCTALAVFVVLGYAWTVYLGETQRYASGLIAEEFQVSAARVQQLLQQAETRAQSAGDLSAYSDLQELALFAAVLLVVVLPALVAGWSARRFAGPLSQLSAAAHRITSGDFSARAVNKTLERRGDETAMLLKDFNTMASALERLEGERRYDVAAIAHELRTPVTVLRGRLEGVRDGVILASPAEFARLMGHADLLAKLIEDLQLLSLLQVGELSLEREVLTVQEVLKRVQTDFSSNAQAKGIGLFLDLPPDPVRVCADCQRLEQVLGNLLSNALRHTPEGGRITLRLTTRGEDAVLDVEDSGPGFTPEALERAFERFYRSPDRARQRGGSGLGLAISRSLVEAHGGRIELFNTGSGACVRVTLKWVV
jgi:signal transduction histidine kinase